MTNRVVVTGYGAVSPLGITADQTWHNLISSVNGIDTIQCFDTSTFPVKVAGEVKNFDPVNYMDPKTARYTDRFAQFAITASRQAIEQAGLVIDDENRYEIGILIGTRHRRYPLHGRTGFSVKFSRTNAGQPLYRTNDDCR